MNGVWKTVRETRSGGGGCDPGYSCLNNNPGSNFNLGFFFFELMNS